MSTSCPEHGFKALVASAKALVLSVVTILPEESKSS